MIMTSPGDLLKFLQKFQESMEEKIVVTQESIDATNKKIDRRLDKLDEEVPK